MEQAHEVKAPEPVEVWAEAGLAEAEEAVLRQVPADTVSAQTVVRGFPTRWELPATSRDAPSVGRL